jgi:hypothetical protein
MFTARMHSTFFRSLVLSFPLMIAVSCQKGEQADPTEVGTKPISSASPKVDPFMLTRNDAGTVSFSVYKWSGSCGTPYGSVTNECDGNDADVTVLSGQSYVRGTNASCTLNGTFYSMLYLQRGTNNTAGTWGPWYLIKPNFGPSITVRKNLLLRVKHVSLVGGTYNKGISYDGTTNIWNTASAVASGNFEVQELVGPFDLCGGH